MDVEAFGILLCRSDHHAVARQTMLCGKGAMLKTEVNPAG